MQEQAIIKEYPSLSTCIFSAVIMMFNASRNLLDTAYEFQYSIIKGKPQYAWQLLTLKAKKAIDKNRNSLISIETAVEMFRRSGLEPPAVEGTGFFNAKLTNYRAAIYFRRGISGWRVEYIGPVTPDQISAP